MFAFNRPILCLLITAYSLAAPPTSAQSVCDEPTASDYVEQMAAMRAQVDAGNFLEVLLISDWALQHYDYAPLHYSRARALHRLERWNEASQAYDQFITSHTGCPDPGGLRERAASYRLEAAGRVEPVTTPTPDQAGFDWAWAPVIAGSTLIVAGGVYDLANQGLLDDQEAAARLGDPASYRQATDALDRAEVVDWVLYGVGGAALAVGVVLLVTGDEPANDSGEAGISWTLSPDRVGLAYQGDW